MDEDQLLKPSDFPVGSLKSRAAARSLLRQRWNSVERVTYYINIGGLNRFPQGRDPANPHASKWFKQQDGKLCRYVSLPSGMSPEEAERLLGED